MPLEQRIALFGGIIPGLLTAISLVAAWWIPALINKNLHANIFVQRAAAPAERDRTPPFREAAKLWVAPVLVFVAVCLADWVINGRWVWQFSHNATFRFPHAVGLFALAGVIEALIPAPSWSRAPFRAAAAVGAMFLLVHPYVGGAVEPGAFWAWTVIAAAAAAVTVTAAETGAQRLGAFATAAALAPGLAIAIGAMSHSTLVSQMLAEGHWLGSDISGEPAGYKTNLSYPMQTGHALIAVLVAAGGVALVVRPLTLARGGMTAIAGAALCWAIAGGFWDDDVSIPTLALVAATPAGLAVAAWRVFDDRPRWQRALAAGAATSAIALLANLAAFLDRTPPSPASIYGY